MRVKARGIGSDGWWQEEIDEIAGVEGKDESLIPEREGSVGKRMRCSQREASSPARRPLRFSGARHRPTLAQLSPKLPCAPPSLHVSRHYVEFVVDLLVF